MNIPPPTSSNTNRGRTERVRFLSAVLLLVGAVGCTPKQYRWNADHESYSILSQKTEDVRWQTPRLTVEPAPHSRMADPFDRDRPPMPPDDPAAHVDMHSPGGMRGYRHWHRDGDAPWIESPDWQLCLPRTESDALRLTPERSFELALINSREYQFELEDLYLSALALTFERFEYRLHWFGGNTTNYFQFGSGGLPTETNTLATTSDLGFTWALAAGGQLFVDLANTFVWEFTGVDTVNAKSNIAISFVQPLLRQAGRNIRLESLTQAERSTLYQARKFARFRKQFYIDIISGRGGFQSLLLQLQNIRNLEANLQSLEQELRTHEALVDAGLVSQLQVDQVFQNYQAGQLFLIQARNDLETAQDAYKIRLGLPPDVPVVLDDALLAPFELSDRSLADLESQLELLLKGFRELDAAPPLDDVLTGFNELRTLHVALQQQTQRVERGLDSWRPAETLSDEESSRDAFERATQQQVTERLAELSKDLISLERQQTQAQEQAPQVTPMEVWNSLQNLIRKELAATSELFVLETQIRAYVVELTPIQLDTETAVNVAVANRLDLMNERARVVDEWRRIQITANQLKSDLDVSVGTNIGTRPGTANPFEFSAAGTSYTAGLRFDGPLNRMAERNIYREQLIEYQRARRSFMAKQDGIVQAVRLDQRRLEANRLNFEIARQSLIVAARQVEMARLELLAPGPAGDSSTTIFALNALNSLLQAKNTLIGVWVDYETNRLLLMFDTELMQLDLNGAPLDESYESTDQSFEPEELIIPRVDFGDAESDERQRSGGDEGETVGLGDAGNDRDDRRDRLPLPSPRDDQ